MSKHIYVHIPFCEAKCPYCSFYSVAGGDSIHKEYFNALKAKLAQTSTDSYQRKYEQAVRELEAQKQAGRLQEEEFNRKYDELEASYQIQLSNLDNYIDQFARIDLSEVSDEEQRIMEMVEEGRLDEAVEAYGALDLSGRLRQARVEGLQP